MNGVDVVRSWRNVTTVGSAVALSVAAVGLCTFTLVHVPPHHSSSDTLAADQPAPTSVTTARRSGIGPRPEVALSAHEMRIAQQIAAEEITTTLPDRSLTFTPGRWPSNVVVVHALTGDYATVARHALKYPGVGNHASEAVIAVRLDGTFATNTGAGPGLVSTITAIVDSATGQLLAATVAEHPSDLPTLNRGQEVTPPNTWPTPGSTTGAEHSSSP